METGHTVNRCDRMDLPTTLDTGARRLPVVLARVGVLRYPWGLERTDADVLSDPAFLESLSGIPVMVGIGDTDHPERVTVDDTGGAFKAGVVLAARFDATTGALVGELVIDEREGLQAVARGVRGVSLAYKVDVTPTSENDRADGATSKRTRMYDPNHVILTLIPRSPGAAVRADNANGGTVEGFDPTKWPEYVARMDAMGSGLEDLKGRMDALDAKIGPALEKWAAQEAKEPEHRADSAATAGVWRSILAAADVHKVEIAADASLDAARKAVGAAVVGKERADSLSADALDIAIEMAGKRQDSRAGFTFADLALASRSVPADGAGRQDSEDNVSPLRGA